MFGRKYSLINILSLWVFVPFSIFFISPQIAFAQKVDLQAVGALIPRISSTSIKQGGYVQFRYRLYNAGPSIARSVKVKFYLSKTPQFDAKSIYFAVEKTVTIAPRKYYPSSIYGIMYDAVALQLPTNAPVGLAYVGVYVNPDKKIPESNYNNNTKSVKINILKAATRDLVFASLIPSTSKVIPGQTLTLTYLIRNEGSLPISSPFEIDVRLSKDKMIDYYDKLLFNKKIASLPPRSFQKLTFKITLPTKLSAGQYYILGLVDSRHKIREVNEHNNLKIISIQVMANTDLTLSHLTTSSMTIKRGAYLSVRGQVHNIGTSTIRDVLVKFYLSYDANISTQDIDLRASYRLRSLSAGASANFYVSVLIPKNVRKGRAHIGAIVDPYDKIKENNERNNTIGTPIYINDVNSIDLAPTSFQLRHINVKQGEKINILYTVSNLGFAAAREFKVAFYYSTNSYISTGDTLLGKATLSLKAGEKSALKNIVVSIPAYARLGSGWLGIFVNYDGQIVENNRSNNILNRKINVLPAKTKDLIITGFWATPSIKIGENIKVRYRLTNLGNTDITRPFTIRFYLSSKEPSISTRSYYLHYERTVKSLRAHATLFFTETIPSSSIKRFGRRYIGALADYSNKIAETDESNNVGLSPIVIAEKQRPELVISSLSLSSKFVAQGEKVTVRYRIRNFGGVGAGSFLFRLYLVYSHDMDVFAQRSWHYLNVETKFAKLAANTESKEYSSSVTIPLNASLGSAWIGGYVDAKDQVKESHELDNTATTRLMILQGVGAPDLTIPHLAVQPASIYRGKTLKVLYQVSNIGKQDVKSAFTVKIYLGKSQKYITKSDILLKVDRKIAGLKAGGILPAAKQDYIALVALPASVKADKYYLKVWVDGDNTVQESSERNNIAAKPIVVMNPPSFVDKDKDGVPVPFDCDDNDASVHPAYKNIKAAVELCDGKDNNCNKKVDEGLTRSCYPKAAGCSGSQGHISCVGICKAGTQICQAGHWGSCQNAVLPKKEVCNKLDDDCDGIIDEDGVCNSNDKDKDKDGVPAPFDCDDNDASVHPAYKNIKAAEEVCDGKDNNCNKKIDEGLTRSCYPKAAGCSGSQGHISCVGICKAGTQTCQAGKWGSCQNAVLPKKEVCNQLDDDCDGIIDEDGVCPPAADCYQKGCPQGEICKEGQCVADPCDGIQCNDGEFCRDGSCVQACGCQTCAQGEICQDGHCQNDPCAGVSCKKGEICDPQSGQCVADACRSVQCQKGRICKDGKCVDDPCRFIKCPAKMKCVDAQCVGVNCSSATNEPADEGVAASETTAPDAGTNEVVADAGQPTESVQESAAQIGDRTVGNSAKKLPDVVAGGGCSISSPSSSSPLWFFMLLLFFIPALRRKFR